MTWAHLVSIIALMTFLTSLAAKSAEMCGEPSPEDVFAEEVLNVVFPQSADINLHYLYKNYKMNSPHCRDDEVWVQGPVFTEKGLSSTGQEVAHDKITAQKLANAFCLSKKEFEKEKKIAHSVFQTRVSSGSKNEGTSFLVGDNIIMTNHHIAAPGPDGKNCKALEITLNKEPKAWIPCKKVLFCDKQKDFCFVEMKMPPGKKISDEVPKLPLDCSPLAAQKARIIGNSYKFGIQGSKGPVFGSPNKDGRFNHRIPMTGGASGSPIVSEGGKVIGINFGHTVGEDFVSKNPKAYNLGTTINSIWFQIKLANLTYNSYGNVWNKENADDVKKVYDVMAAHPSCK